MWNTLKGHWEKFKASSTSPEPVDFYIPVIQFTPYQTFFSKEFNSQYVEGLRYTVRPGNVRLRILVDKWLTQKKIYLVRNDATPRASLYGNGVV